MKLLPSMFPPLSNAQDSEEIRTQLKQCCRRFLPHLMNTGGFFVVAIEKIAEAPASSRQARKNRDREREPEADDGNVSSGMPTHGADGQDDDVKPQQPGDDAATPSSSTSKGNGKSERKGKGKKDDKNFAMRK